MSRLLGWLVAELDPADREPAFAALRARLDEHRTPQGVVYPSSSWIITARRR
jgi:hypothetical protein